MNQDKPPPYSAALPAPGFSIPPPHGQPPLQRMEVPNRAYKASPQQQTTQVIITPVPLVVAFGPNPMNVVCPSCHAEVLTTVTTEPNTKTHLFALLLCAFGLYCCCCFPYCVDSCQSQNHHCPNCQSYLGNYQN